jgi:hypothetical protein
MESEPNHNESPYFDLKFDLIFSGPSYTYRYRAIPSLALLNEE